MKKIIFITTLCFLLITTAFPYIKGIILKREIEGSFRKINENITAPGSETFIKIKTYKTGYLTSEMIWQISSPFFRQWTGTNAIFLKNRLKHNFSDKIVSQTTLERNTWYKHLIDSQTDGLDPIAITTEYKIGGDVNFQIDLKRFEINQKKEKIRINPGQARIQLKDQGHRMIGEASWKGIRIPGKWELQPLRIQTDQTKKSSRIWTGTGLLQLEGLLLESGPSPIQIRDLFIDYALDCNQTCAAVSIDLSGTLQSLSSNSIRISDAGGKLFLGHLDSKGLEEVVRIIAGLKNKLLKKPFLSNISGTDIQHLLEDEIQKLGFQAVPLAEKFLKKGLKVRLEDFKATVPEGEIRADVELALKKGVTLAGFLPVLVRPGTALDILSLRSDIRFPYALTGYDAKLLSPLFEGMRTGLFILDGTDLVHQAQIQNEKLFLNQKEVALP